MNCALDRTSFSCTVPGRTVRVGAPSIEHLQADGYRVTAPQFPLTSLAGEVMTAPAWKSLPSWYLVAQDDQALPADVQRMFATRMRWLAISQQRR